MPERSSSQSSGYSAAPFIPLRVCVVAISRPPSVRRLEGVHPRLGARHGLARALELELLDLGGLTRALDLRHAVEVAEHETAVHDVELVAVEPAHRRPCDAVALLVVRAAVAGADEAGRGQDRRDVDIAVGGLDRLPLLGEDRAAGLHRAADMCAAVGDDREARGAVQQAVVAHEGRAAGNLALPRVADERDDFPVVLLEIRDRAEIDLVRLLLDEPRHQREAERGQRRDCADDRAEAECRALEELAAREALTGLGRRHRRLALVCRNRRRAVGGRRAAFCRERRLAAGGDFTRPEEAEDERDSRPDGGDGPADDQPDKQADDADGEPDRPQAGRRKLRSVVPRALFQAGLSFKSRRLDSIVAGWLRQRRNSWLNERSRRPFPWRTGPSPYSSQRSSTSRRTSSLIAISSGHGRVPSSGPLCVASMPSLPP